MDDRAPIISFEGLDGSGKTTQLRLVSEYLDENGIDNNIFREPGGSKLAERIRSILLEPDLNPPDVSEVLLFQAARSSMFETEVRPTVYDGTVALLDRAGDSTIAYQGFGLFDGDKQKLDWISQNNRQAYGELSPDRTYWIDISAEESLQRKNEDEKDRIESKDIHYKERVNRGFSHVYRNHHNRIVQVDGEQDVEDVFETVRDDIMNYLREHEYA